MTSRAAITVGLPSRVGIARSNRVLPHTHQRSTARALLLAVPPPAETRARRGEPAGAPSRVTVTTAAIRLVLWANAGH